MNSTADSRVANAVGSLLRFSAWIAAWNALFLIISIAAAGLVVTVALAALVLVGGTGQPNPAGSFNTGMWVGTVLAVLETPIFLAWTATLFGYSQISRTPGIRARVRAAVGYGLAVTVLMMVLAVIAISGVCSIMGCSGVD